MDTGYQQMEEERIYGLAEKLEKKNAFLRAALAEAADTLYGAADQISMGTGVSSDGDYCRQLAEDINKLLEASDAADG